MLIMDSLNSKIVNFMKMIILITMVIDLLANIDIKSNYFFISEISL